MLCLKNLSLKTLISKILTALKCQLRYLGSVFKAPPIILLNTVIIQDLDKDIWMKVSEAGISLSVKHTLANSTLKHLAAVRDGIFKGPLFSSGFIYL